MIKADKILIRSPNWVGDVVMATPAFRNIRESFPHAKISILLKPYVKLILKDSPWFDNFIEYGSDIKLIGKGYGKFRKLTKRLKEEDYDLGFIFPNSFSSAVMFWLAGVRKRIGYIRDARGWLLTDGLERVKKNGKFAPAYMADYYLRLCYAVGCKEVSNHLELFTSNEDENRLDKILSKYKITSRKHTILINPGAAYGSSKCWTSAGFAQTIDLLNKTIDCNIILVSAPGEIKFADDIAKTTNSTVYNLSNDNITLDLLKPLVKKSSLLLTVDSGPRHFAVAFNTPTVVLMGPTDPRYTKTKWEIGHVIRQDVSCGPCHKKICPIDHICMEKIIPEKVVEACVEILKIVPQPNKFDFW